MYRHPLDGWVGYLGEYLGVNGGWVDPMDEYVHCTICTCTYLLGKSLSHDLGHEIIIGPYKQGFLFDVFSAIPSSELPK